MVSSTTERELETQNIIERGQRLADILRQLGWPDVLDIMNSVIEEANNDLLKAEPGDLQKIAGLHAQARAAKAVRDLTLHRIDEYVEAAKHLKKQREQEDYFRSHEVEPYDGTSF